MAVVPDSNYSTLQNIQQKVRRITRAPGPSQMSDNTLNQYINSAILYDFPNHLRLFSLRTNFTFYTQPNIDTYTTQTTDINDPFYNFNNNYVAIHQPLYIAGVQCTYSQWPDDFFGYWPNTVTTTHVSGLFGNGTTGPFTGTLEAFPIYQNNVQISCLDINNTAMILIDYPINNETGYLSLFNDPQPTLPSPYGTIDYLTGQFTAYFPNNTANNGTMNPVQANIIPYQPGKPIAALYYNYTFTLRPCPDTVYPVQLEADIRPTVLLQQTDAPQLSQWWEFISYLAAKKVFEDRGDYASIDQMMPSLREQMNLVNRASITQQANSTSETIYNSNRNVGWAWWGNINWPY